MTEPTNKDAMDFYATLGAEEKPFPDTYPCPFCDGKMEYKHLVYFKHCYYECGCGARTRFANSKLGAVKYARLVVKR